MIDSAINMKDNRYASQGFERSSYADNEGNVKARISKGLVFRKAKVVSLIKFRFVGQFNRTLSNSGFFTPLDAATTALDRLLKSAGCGGKIGYCKPLSASLVALVSDYTTWKRQSGRYDLHRNNKHPSCALGLCSWIDGAGSKEPIVSLMPL